MLYVANQKGSGIYLIYRANSLIRESNSWICEQGTVRSALESQHK